MELCKLSNILIYYQVKNVTKSWIKTDPKEVYENLNLLWMHCGDCMALLMHAFQAKIQMAVFQILKFNISHKIVIYFWDIFNFSLWKPAI